MQVLVLPCLPLLPRILERATAALENVQKVGQENKQIKAIACREEKQCITTFLSLGKVY